MKKSVNVHEAKTHLSRLLELAHSGEEIVIAKNGQPYARLTALTPPKKRELGFLNLEIPDAFFEPLPDELLDQWQ